MHAEPSVSVVIPAYNAKKYLGEAIESALTQTMPPLEIIVVDDGSTDETAAVAGSFADRVRVIQQANAGQAAARNRALGEARGSHVAFLDADDRWRPQKIELQLKVLLENPELGLVYCAIETMDERGEPGEVRQPTVRGQAFAAFLLREPTQICGSSILIRRDLLKEIGGFDPSLTPCEETDLLLRVASRHPIDFVAEPLVCYRIHEGNAHRNVDNMARAWRLLYSKAARMPEARRLGRLFRARCRGKLHRMLAGDYAQAGRQAAAVREAIQCFLWWPPALLPSRSASPPVP